MTLVLFCPTVPSSGTTFVKKFFQNGHVQVRRLSMILDGRVNIEGAKIYTLVHTHFMYHHDKMEEIWDFDEYPTIVPMRDPLASMLTFSSYDQISQNQAFRIDRRMEEYVHALQLQERRPVMYVPVDLEKTEQERYDLLKKIAHGWVPEDKIREWAREWKPQNSKTAGKARRQWYADRDIDKIRAHLQVDGRWQQLKQYENEVRPYLEQMGYTDLMWYE